MATEKQKETARRWQVKNPAKLKANNQKYRKSNPQVIRRYELKRKYGISTEDYDALVISQGGLCSICLTVPDKLHIDHDHSTKKIRGLLCRHCNVGLGQFKDNSDNLLRAATYLKEKS